MKAAGSRGKAPAAKVVACGVKEVQGMVRVCFERWFACWGRRGHGQACKRMPKPENGRELGREAAEDRRPKPASSKASNHIHVVRARDPTGQPRYTCVLSRMHLQATILGLIRIRFPLPNPTLRAQQQPTSSFSPSIISITAATCTAGTRSSRWWAT
jgi:hypothetical protein